MTQTSDELRVLDRLDLIAVPAPLMPHERAEERSRELAALHEEMAECRKCQMAGYLQQANPVAGFRGRIGNRMLLVGQAPGRLSALKNEPFSGPGGRVLEMWLQRAGFAPGALRRDVYLSALTRCDPGRNPRGSGDRKPSLAEIALCRPYLLRELELVRPHAILLVGGMAIAAFHGPARLEEVVGEAFERNGAHLLPLPHPSGVSRWLNDPEHQALLTRGLDRLSRWRQEWLAEDAAMASVNTSSTGGTDDGD
jgi:uracil-DNA glycosylase family 4